MRVALLLALAVAAACGDGGARRPSAPSAAPICDPPAQILGLTVGREDVSETLERSDRPVILEDVRLYSLREPPDLLQATLQVGRFDADAPWNADGFQRTVIGQIGGTNPVVVHIGEQTVHLTTSKGLRIAVWFSRGRMFTLALRDTFDRPKALLRTVVGSAS